VRRFRCDAKFLIAKAKMLFRFHGFAHAVALFAMLALPCQFFAQQSFAQTLAQADDVDPELRVQQLENQLRQLTGQNEELQFRNRQLEEQIRQLQAGAPPAATSVRPNVAMAPPPRPGPAPAQQQPGYDQQAAVPPPIIEEPAPPPVQGRRRGDAFDPSQNPTALGAPRALGGGGLPVPAEAPGARGPGEPLDLANANGAREGAGAPPPPPRDSSGVLTTLPPSQTPKDEFDLGIGYMQRRDYALAEETMRNFAQKYPGNPLIADSQYWLGESFFQRQQYREAAEAFLAVTTKFGTAAKAPDALLRLGQSLAALKEKEAACAAFDEVTRKYPRASAGVKQTVDREQKRVKC
jgi:tol-pal system protein YbgF